MPSQATITSESGESVLSRSGGTLSPKGVHPLLAAALLQDLEQAHPADPAKPLPPQRICVPCLWIATSSQYEKASRMRVKERGVARQELVQGLVGEHHAEAERVVGPVLLVDLDLPAGPALLGQERAIEPAGSAADHRDAHEGLLLVGAGSPTEKLYT